MCHKQTSSPVRNGSEVYICIKAKVFNFACVCNTCIIGVFCHHHDTVLYFSICQKDIWSIKRYKIYGPLTQACLTLDSNHFHSCSSLQNIKPVRCGQMWLRDNSNRDSTAWRLPSLWMWYVQWKWKYFWSVKFIIEKKFITTRIEQGFSSLGHANTDNSDWFQRTWIKLSFVNQSNQYLYDHIYLKCFYFSA